MELLFIFSSFIIAVLLIVLVNRRSVTEAISVFAAAVALAGAVSVAIKTAAFGTYSLAPFFFVDALGAIILLLIACVGMAATAYSVYYLREETAKGIIGSRRVRQYFILLNLFMVMMFLAVCASSVIMTWIFIEATTLATVFLVSFYNRPSSAEGAWKYLIINSVGLLLGFFGTILYLSPHATGANTFATWNGLLANAAHLDPLITKIAFIFVFIGYGVKAGFAPMHTWLPDAHSKASAPVSALLSGVLLNIALYAILRFQLITDVAIGKGYTSHILIAFGIVSVGIAAGIIFTQQSYKRLLAYSSIENMGIVALGVGFGGLGMFAAILHLVYHSLIKSALFLLSGNFLLAYSSAKIKNVRGGLSVVPMTSVLFLAGVLAIIGAPPFGIFMTKLTILSAGISSQPVLTIIALFLFAIVFVGLFKHAVAMVFGEKPDGVQVKKEDAALILPPLLLLMAALYISFHMPHFLRTVIDNAITLYE